MSKYGNRQHASIDGTVFSSKREANRYNELVVALRCGVIKELKTQVKFELIPAQKVGKVTERPVTYMADFTYRTTDGVLHVEDAKGFRTQQYIIRRKLMLWVHKLAIEEW